MLSVPIAVVGRACVLPGALSPEALGEAVLAGRDLTRSVPAGRWGLDPQSIACAPKGESKDRTWSDRGGYVSGFEDVFDPTGFCLPKDELQALDPLFQWVLHCGRLALAPVKNPQKARARVILGNLSFPSAGQAERAAWDWLGANGWSDAQRAQAGLRDRPARDRFPSGLPALLLARTLGLGGGAWSLDAACASGLYALAQGCDALAQGRADLVLSGAVNRADDLFIHVGFCALSALSRSGQSRPFHKEADGLLPAEGCVVVALKRLDDAVRDGDEIHAVLRGVGLSNDGRDRGLLAPAEAGQLRALRAAWTGLDLDRVGLLECHATGTPVGDATELKSMGRLFTGHEGLPIGSLKSNLGHLVTVAGLAALLKVSEAMKAGVRPPSLHATVLNPALAGSPFRVLQAAEPWERGASPRTAGISAFGFGGNNAHVVVEEYERGHILGSLPRVPTARVAIVGLAARVGDAPDTAAWLAARARAQAPEAPSAPEQGSTRAEAVELPIAGLRFPPRDLAQGIAQHTLLLAAAAEALRDHALPRDRTAVLMGMGTDAEVARWGARWRISTWLAALGEPAESVAAAKDAFVPGLEAAGVLGTMPNLPANRINFQFDLAGPSFTVSAEELSGVEALRLAVEALSVGSLDAAVVGAVDLSHEPVHVRALTELSPGAPPPLDAAFVLVLRRLDDALSLGLPILAVVEPAGAGPVLRPPRAPSAHAASGLQSVIEAALDLGAGDPLRRDLTHRGPLSLELRGLEGARAFVHLSPPPPSAPKWAAAAPFTGQTLRLPAHLPAPALPPLGPPTVKRTSMSTMPTAPALPSVFDSRAPTLAEAAPLEDAWTPGHDSTAEAVAAAIHNALAFTGVVHRQALEAQASQHAAFLSLRERSLATMMQLAALEAHPPPPYVLAGAAPTASPSGAARHLPHKMGEDGPTPIRVGEDSPTPIRVGEDSPTPIRVAEESARPLPTGLTLDRAGLQIHASGRISEIFGPRFVEQDGFRRQCRMPEPPLLLADRMTGLRAEPASQGTGTVWTETDVRDDSWWLHQGRMPAGIHIESGQADLLLISYLGADLLNQDKRAYRLLGCALTWHGDLPKPGETLCYDIHVDGHARQGDVRLFFFHYDCRINGELRLSVRHGQAGFFTDEELAGSAGVIWSPEDESLPPGKPLDPPAVKGTKTAFSDEDVIAFSEGRTWECFGPGFEWTKTHVRTPRIQSGQMRFLGSVPVLDPTGGPWGRGYLRAETTLSDDDWYYKGHFKNDPCMPGTLMFEGTVQALSFLMAGMGFTVKRDGWRFQPVKDETFLMRCRGQVIPGSKKLVYEVFVREVVAGPIPTVRADLLCTVDGLKAFHARAVGLELVPDWPITSRPELLATHVDAGPVAEMDGFQYGYASLLACAWGRPSDAFGPRYAIFDGARTVPRLPGPPYHFMSRIRSVSEPIGAMKAGVTVVADYDIPADAWYFAENGQPAMPLAVLMEAALQPCGWLASWAGAALESPIDLGFRNLDGTGTMHRPVLPGDGTLTTTANLTRLSRTAGMVIVAFEVRSALQTGELIYTMDTVFGFFPAEALASQAGLPTTPAQRAWLTDPSDTRIDLRTKPAPFFRPGGLATGRLLMLDRITGLWPEGGEAGKGRLRAEKDVDAGEWFFKAHFYTDPVQPGSLGVEAMLQAVQAWMLHQGRDQGVEHAIFEPIAVGRAISWKYRGQVQAMDRLISTTIDVLEEGVDAEGCPYTLAAASLWIDGKRIYEARPVGMRVRPGPPPSGPKTVRLDPAVDRWVADHCPTWTVPALPMMDIVDRLAAAAGPAATGLADLRLQGWVVVDRPRTLETRLEGDRVLLFVDGAEAARARVLTDAAPAPSPWPALQGEPEPDPYAAGALFHGPAFAVLRSLVLRPDGSTAHLDAAPTAAPLGRLHPALLDGATHGIPHEELGRWFPGLDHDRVAYPAGLRELRWWGPPPTSGVVRVEARPVGKLGAHAVALSVQLIVDEPRPRVWASFTLIEASFPKGPIGQAPRPLRRAFLQGFAVPGLGLAAHGPDGTTLRQADVEGSDWLPGTVEALYGTRDLTAIAVKEHLAVWTGLHPRVLPEALPLNRFPLSVTEAEGQVTVAPAGPPSLDLSPVERYWSDWFGLPGWPVEDIFYSLIHRFLRRVVTVDPAGLRRLHGRSVLFLANHQVGVESLLFSVLASGLIGNPTLTLAKAEHQHTWLGDLIRHSFRWPGAKDPQVIAYFDREDKGSLLRIAGELALGMAAGERSVMVHIEGTRSLSCETPVQKMSGIFIDMALQTGVPIVPVRFVGGLPRAAMANRIEYPIGLGSQDIYLGAPIEPEALRDLLPGARKTKVINAINALGPPNALETPNPGDPIQEAEAQAWATTNDARIEHAVLWSVLDRMREVGPQMERLRSVMRWGGELVGEDEETAWLQVLLEWFRPRG